MTWYAHPLGLINPAEVYLSAPYLFDALIYLLIFLGLATAVYQKGFGSGQGLYGKSSGKPIAIGVGLALTMSVLVAEWRMGWYLGAAELSILPLAVLAILIFLLFFEALKSAFGQDKSKCAIALAYLLTYIGIVGMFEAILESTFIRFPLIGAFLFILNIIAIIILGTCIAGLFGGGGSEPSRPPAAPKAAEPRPKREPEPKEPTPLEVVIDSPPRGKEFKPGEEIELQGTLSGGSEKDHEWVWLVNGTQLASGKGSKAKAKTTNHSPGPLRIDLKGGDKSTAKDADITLNIKGVDIDKHLKSIEMALKQLLGNNTLVALQSPAQAPIPSTSLLGIISSYGEIAHRALLQEALSPQPGVDYRAPVERFHQRVQDGKHLLDHIDQMLKTIHQQYQPPYINSQQSTELYLLEMVYTATLARFTQYRADWQTTLIMSLQTQRPHQIPPL